MGGYAQGTSVSAERSQDEIRSFLRKRGADQFLMGEDDNGITFMFRMEARIFRFIIKVPDETEFLFTDAGRKRKPEAVRKEVEGEWRRRWRVLGLVLKAKMELVDTGVVELEEEFLAHLLTDDGHTVYEHVRMAVDGKGSKLLGTMPAPKALGMGS